MVAVNYLLAGGFIFLLVILAFIFTVLQLKNKQKQHASAFLPQTTASPELQEKKHVVSESTPEPVDPRVAQLREVISTRLRAGYTKQQLYDALVSKGWDTTTLDKAFKGF